MVVNYFGDGCFRLQSGDLSLLVDPNSNRLKADVVLKTLTSTESPETASDEISFAGEYEKKGIEIHGWPVGEESTDKFVKTVYAIRWEDMRFVFLGHISGTLSNELLEEIGEPDLLFLPVGGKPFLEGSDAAKLVKQIEPAVVIPSFFKSPAEFLKALGQKGSPQEKFVFKQKDIADKKSEAVVLESKA